MGNGVVGINYEGILVSFDLQREKLNFGGQKSNYFGGAKQWNVAVDQFCVRMDRCAKGTIPICSAEDEYCESRVETISTGKSTLTAATCVKNELEIRPGNLYAAKLVSVLLYAFCDLQKCPKHRNLGVDTDW